MKPPNARPRVRFAILACIGVFLWAIAQFYVPDTGFTSLIKIGDEMAGTETTALRRVPHYVYENSSGYDGAYYAQIALDPALTNPELTKSIDNLPYRARRILFSWIAWLAGLGRPEWILQAHALLNVVAWLALAFVLLRWFPPTNWENFLRWFAMMFTHGVCMSVRDSLVDAPALLLVALAMAAEEDGRRTRAAVWLALAGLGRETSLLAVVGLEMRDQRPGTKDGGHRTSRSLLSGLWSLVWRAALIALPLLAWMAYLRSKFGVMLETGVNNFTLPLTGLAQKWGATFAEIQWRDDSPLRWATLAVTLGLTVQFLFFALRWRPGERWWRVGATFAVLMMFLAKPVWEGFPGAAPRALLPMTLAFNILVPRGRTWLAILLLGNLTVAASYREFDPPARDMIEISGDHEWLAAVNVSPTTGWYGPEDGMGARWRWSSGSGVLRIRNQADRPLTVVFHGHAMAAHDERHLRINVGAATASRDHDAMVWSGELTSSAIEFQFGCVVPPGETTLTFLTDKAGHAIGNDGRTLAFKISNLAIVVKPVPGQ